MGGEDSFPALRPLVSNLLQTEIDLSVLYSLKAVLLSVLLIAVVGLLSGLLPSVLVSAVRPVDVVKGTFRRRSKMVFSKVFIVLQNAVTIGMLAAVLVMVLQLRHLLHAPLGYNTANILMSILSITMQDSRLWSWTGWLLCLA